MDGNIRLQTERETARAAQPQHLLQEWAVAAKIPAGYGPDRTSFLLGGRWGHGRFGRLVRLPLIRVTRNELRLNLVMVRHPSRASLPRAVHASLVLTVPCLGVRHALRLSTLRFITCVNRQQRLFMRGYRLFETRKHVNCVDCNGF